jgi:hypothetical protein
LPWLLPPFMLFRLIRPARQCVASVSQRAIGSYDESK